MEFFLLGKKADGFWNEIRKMKKNGIFWFEKIGKGMRGELQEGARKKKKERKFFMSGFDDEEDIYVLLGDLENKKKREIA